MDSNSSQQHKPFLTDAQLSTLIILILLSSVLICFIIIGMIVIVRFFIKKCCPRRPSPPNASRDNNGEYVSLEQASTSLHRPAQINQIPQSTSLLPEDVTPLYEIEQKPTSTEADEYTQSEQATSELSLTTVSPPPSANTEPNQPHESEQLTIEDAEIPLSVISWSQFKHLHKNGDVTKELEQIPSFLPPSILTGPLHIPAISTTQPIRLYALNPDDSLFNLLHNPHLVSQSVYSAFLHPTTNSSVSPDSPSNARAVGNNGDALHLGTPGLNLEHKLRNIVSILHSIITGLSILHSNPCSLETFSQPQQTSSSSPARTPSSISTLSDLLPPSSIQSSSSSSSSSSSPFVLGNLSSHSVLFDTQGRVFIAVRAGGQPVALWNFAPGGVDAQRWGSPETFLATHDFDSTSAASDPSLLTVQLARENAQLTPAADVFSFGTIMWEVFAVAVPFADECSTSTAALAEIGRGELPSGASLRTGCRKQKIPTDVRNKVSEIIQKCHNVRAAERPTAKEVGEMVDQLLSEEKAEEEGGGGENEKRDTGGGS